MQRYDKKVERHMRLFYDSLSEKDRRRYAAVEAEKLGHGGVEYVAEVMQCHPSTVRQGREDIFQLPKDEAPDRVRKKGGRKNCLDSMPALEKNFAQVVENETAGDPMRDNVKWTYHTLASLSEALGKLGSPVGADVVKQLLTRHDFVKRKMQKSRTRMTVNNRNEQFEKIAVLKAEYEAEGP